MLLPYSKETFPRTNCGIQSLAICKVGHGPFRPLPKGRGSASFVIVPIDHFIKWVEAKPLAKIKEGNTSKILWKNITCQFGISYSII